jgi:lipid-binding SYLF domain-containing protein
MTARTNTIWIISFATTLAAAAALSLAVTFAARAATAEDLNRDSFQALRHLTQSNSAAAAVARSARAVLVFPNIVKAGLVFGGAYGEGTLIEGNRVVDYYNSVSGSWGLQAGAQSYGYVVFLMNDKAVDYIERTAGFEVGVGPTVVIVDEGVAKNLSTTTLKDDAYAFIFNQQGLMAGISLEGTKISRIDRGRPSQASR